MLPATLCALNMTLTYQIRPVEDLALPLKFVLAGTSAGAGDTLDITGTDWRGAAQVESINVAAGNGTYTGTKYWRTITDIDCTGWADGTLRVAQSQWGVIWDYGNGQYRIDCQLNIGDASTSTYFTTVGESSVLPSDTYAVTANATFTVGEVANGYGGKPTYLKFQGKDYSPRFCNGGTVNFYNTVLDFSGDASLIIVGASTLNIRRLSIYSGGNYFYVRGTTTFDIEDFYAYDSRFYFRETLTNNGFVRLHADGDSVGAFACALEVAFDIDQLLITNSISNDFFINANTKLIDPLFHPTQAKIHIATNGIWIREKYTCNIHIADKDGANLASATVLCEDTDGTQVFSVSTDANGDIAEQQVTYKQWIDTAETETTLSPHKFTISKAGKETLVLDEITVDASIVWHLELLDELAESDVRDGLAYGEDSEGTLDLPSINDVEDGVTFDGATKEGNFEAPAEEDVEVGVGYGSLGSEFLGTYLGLTGNNLTAVLERNVDLVGYLEKSVDLVGCLQESVELVGYLEKKTTLTGQLEKKVTLTGELTS